MTRTLTPEQVPDDLQGIGRFLREGDATELMQTLTGHVRRGIRDNFVWKSSPRGQAWPERQRLGDGHPLLIDTGRLYNAATGQGAGSVTRVEPREVAVGVDSAVVPYAAAHNFGVPARNLPQREYIGVRVDLLNAVDTVVADWIDERL